ncbi:MAG: hypothetical protein PF692_06745 [Kiritimatiellae bacterium]|nr:hypothetical protein [Kiritimatiellia bacterium]
MANIWNSIPIKIIRLIIFIPFGFILLSLLQMIPIALFNWLAIKPFVPTWLSILIAISVVSIAGGIAWFYGTIVYFATILTCRIIAPWHRVSAVIFGTLFLVAEIVSMISWCRAGNPAWFLVYHIIFTLVVVGGLFGSCAIEE